MNDRTGTEIMHRDEAGAVTSSTALSDTAQMLSMMRELALNPDVDANKLETIARVANEQQDRLDKRQFAAAKAAAMAEMPVIDKRGRIVIADKGGDTSKDRVQGTFAKWPDLQRAITPVLQRNFLVLSHDIDHDAMVTLVTPILTDSRTGYTERGGQMALPLDTSGGKNNTQGAGSAASYGKRHTTIAMLGIRLDDSDDDGALLATADEPLNDRQQRIVAAAEEQSAISAGAYQAWFGKLEPRDRAWLVQTGRHATLGGSPPGDAPPAPASAKPRDPDPSKAQGKPAGHDVTTAAGWTAQFKDDMAAAKTMEEVDRIRQRGQTALGRLSVSHPKLFDQADAAELEARDRVTQGKLV